MHEQLEGLLEKGPWAAWKHRPGGVFLLRGDGMPEAERTRPAGGRARGAERRARRAGRPARPALPRAELAGARWWRDRRPRARGRERCRPSRSRPRRSRTPTDSAASPPAGASTPSCCEGDADTPQPWVNVIANERFGTVVGATGAAWTWAGNSRENRLTPFGNDPVSEFSGEAVYLRDEDRGEVWGATPGPAAARARRRPLGHAPWRRRHALRPPRPRRHLRARRCSCTPMSRSSSRALSLTNHTARRAAPERVRLQRVGAVPAARRRAPLRDHRAGRGDRRRAGAQSLQRRLRRARGVRAREPRARVGDRRPARVPGAERLAAAARRRWRASRWGSASAPASTRAPRSRSASTSSPARRARSCCCSARARPERTRWRWPSRFGSVEAARAALEQVEQRWDTLLGTVQVETPDDSFDLIMNRWLLYQAVSSRLWGRTGFFQPGGAYGFRDQLQDVMALGVRAAGPLPRAPAALRRAPVRRGRRAALVARAHRPRRAHAAAPTTCCGCPYAVAHYVKCTGDHAVLDEPRAVPGGARARARRAGGLRPARGRGAERDALRALRPRHRAPA